MATNKNKGTLEKAGEKIIKKTLFRILAPYLLAGLGILLILLFVLFLTVATLVAMCNADGFTGRLARGVSTVGSTLGLIPQDVCSALAGFSGVTEFIDRGSFVSPPRGGADVKRWESLIRTAASTNRLPFCYLRSFLQKESSGDALAIGHDHTAPPPPIKRWQSSSDGRKATAKNAHDPFDISSLPKHNLDWDFSHGIGLMQITVFPYIHDLGKEGWIDSNTPARKMGTKKYKLLELLDPETTINAAAGYVAQLLGQFSGDYQKAAARYNGTGVRADAYGEEIIDLTNICEKTGL